MKKFLCFCLLCSVILAGCSRSTVITREDQMELLSTPPSSPAAEDTVVTLQTVPLTESVSLPEPTVSEAASVPEPEATPEQSQVTATLPETDPEPALPPPAPATEPVQTEPATTAAPEIYTPEEVSDALMAAITQARTDAGLLPLVQDPSLRQPAEIRRQETASLPGHVRPDGSDWKTVLEGIPYTQAGENRFRCTGNVTLSELTDIFLSIDPILANIRNPAFTGIGLAIAVSQDSCSAGIIFIG